MTIQHLLIWLGCPSPRNSTWRTWTPFSTAKVCIPRATQCPRTWNPSTRAWSTVNWKTKEANIGRLPWAQRTSSPSSPLSKSFGMRTKCGRRSRGRSSSQGTNLRLESSFPLPTPTSSRTTTTSTLPTGSMKEVLREEAGSSSRRWFGWTSSPSRTRSSSLPLPLPSWTHHNLKELWLMTRETSTMKNWEWKRTAALAVLSTKNRSCLVQISWKSRRTPSKRSRKMSKSRVSWTRKKYLLSLKSEYFPY